MLYLFSFWPSHELSSSNTSNSLKSFKSLLFSVMVKTMTFNLVFDENMAENLFKVKH